MSDQDNTVVLVDGEWVLHRAMHQPNLATLSRPSDGLPTGTLLGFLNTIQRLYKVYGRGIAVAWEGGGAEKKRKIYEHYKGNRIKPEQKSIEAFEAGEEPSMDGKVYLNLFRDLIILALEHLHIPSGYAFGCEGDDVLATWARSIQERQPRIKVLIYTRDRDLWQVVTDRCQVVYHDSKTKADVFVDQTRIMEEYVESLGVVWTKVLRGDTSDFIPGVEFDFPGVAKTRRALYPRQVRKILERRPQSFDGLCRTLSEMQLKGQIAKSGFCYTPTSVEDMRRNYALVKLDTECKIEPVAVNPRLRKLMPDIGTMFREFGFTRFANQKKLWAAIAEKVPYIPEPKGSHIPEPKLRRR